MHNNFVQRKSLIGTLARPTSTLTHVAAGIVLNLEVSSHLNSGFGSPSVARFRKLFPGSVTLPKSMYGPCICSATSMIKDTSHNVLGLHCGSLTFMSKPNL